MFLNFFFLQASGAGAAPAAGGGGGGLPMILMVVLAMGVFYFFMIRPQQKRQREEQQYREALQKGDKVMTIGGIYGKVVSIEDSSTVIVEIDANVKIRILKEALRPVPADGSSKS